MFLTTKTWKKEQNALVKMFLNWRNHTNEELKRLNALSDQIIKVEEDLKTGQRVSEETAKKCDAITEFLKSDRNDINALIQIVRKLQSTKGKK